MDVSCIRPNSAEVDQYSSLMEREHVIDITKNGEESSSSSSNDQQPHVVDLPRHDDDSVSSSTRAWIASGSSRGRGDEHGRRSPLNSGLWISVELAVTVGQIIAAAVVLSLAKDEHPQAPLFTWIFGYTCGCVATLPILYWRFRNYNRLTDQDFNQSHGASSRSNNPPEFTPYTSVSVVQAPDEENLSGMELALRNHQLGGSLTMRLDRMADHFKMALDCFFAVWFVVGNVWVFGSHSSPSDAPKLYRLCLVFLTFSCIGYAMPFILCATICCCLPCLISVLGIRENFPQTRGATVESINALPIYKFSSNSVDDHEGLGAGEGGFFLAGSQKKRLVSGDDAVCCICLAKYVDNDELRELPCSHAFHVECVDKWLKINATCPLCKTEVGESSAASS